MSVERKSSPLRRVTSAGAMAATLVFTLDGCSFPSPSLEQFGANSVVAGSGSDNSYGLTLGLYQIGEACNITAVEGFVDNPGRVLITTAERDCVERAERYTGYPPTLIKTRAYVVSEAAVNDDGTKVIVVLGAGILGSTEETNVNEGIAAANIVPTSRVDVRPGTDTVAVLYVSSKNNSPS